MNNDEKAEWRLIRALDGGISGVASQSADVPLKQANFPMGFENLAGAKSYSDWVFEFRPQTAVSLGQTPSTTPSPTGPPVLKTD